MTTNPSEKSLGRILFEFDPTGEWEGLSKDSRQRYEEQAKLFAAYAITEYKDEQLLYSPGPGTIAWAIAHDPVRGKLAEALKRIMRTTRDDHPITVKGAYFQAREALDAYNKTK